MWFYQLGAILLVLIAVTIVGNLWFHTVESLLERFKGLFSRRKAPPAWHELEQEQEERDNDRH